MEIYRKRKMLWTSIMNHKGMSLVEILIALGLLGAVSVGVMQLMKTTQKSSLSGEMAADINQAYNEVSKLVNNPAHCKSSFFNRKVEKGSEISIEALYYTNKDGEGVPFYISGDPKYKIGKVYIQQIGLSMLDETNDGSMMQLRVIFSKEPPGTKREFFGARSITKELNFAVDNCFRELKGGAPKATLEAACIDEGGKLDPVPVSDADTECISLQTGDDDSSQKCYNCRKCALPRDKIFSCGS